MNHRTLTMTNLLNLTHTTQTAAKLRGFSLTASGFTAETDWLLEEDGFEPSVPPQKTAFFRDRPESGDDKPAR